MFPVCLFENNNCCMACLLTKQEEIMNQISMLETVTWEADECIFLPKFHGELNPIEMAIHLEMDVGYCMGLMGRVVQWAIQKQKGHKKAAMTHLDTVPNGS
ncbi:hypothetical protein BYT27DRAFT_7215701 [Phlegmacium glaucopus]|nr:hypothetical protein BYT27DRAFT_7215701 [Phlegmacium glaucopus]